MTNYSPHVINNRVNLCQHAVENPLKQTVSQVISL